MLRSLVFLAPVIVACLLPACAPSPESPASRQLQMYGLIQKFDLYDENGDGYLTRADLGRGVRDAGTIRLTSEELDQVMKAYDGNGDGRISQREAQQGAERGPEIFGPAGL
jgi:Ca2+-binding EF-hand superfamily protein